MFSLFYNDYLYFIGSSNTERVPVKALGAHVCKAAQDSAVVLLELDVQWE